MVGCSALICAERTDKIWGATTTPPILVIGHAKKRLTFDRCLCYYLGGERSHNNLNFVPFVLHNELNKIKKRFCAFATGKLIRPRFFIKTANGVYMILLFTTEVDAVQYMTVNSSYTWHGDIGLGNLECCYADGYWYVYDNRKEFYLS